MFSQYSNAKLWYGDDLLKLEKYKHQTEDRGFDDTELISLDVTIAKFLRDRILAFKSFTKSYPSNMTEDEWNSVLEEMSEGFDSYAAQEGIHFCTNDKIKRALELFKQHFFDLWS